MEESQPLYFGKFLMELGRKAKFTFQTHVGKSSNQWFALWTSVVYICWPSECEHAAESTLPSLGLVIKTIHDLPL